MENVSVKDVVLEKKMNDYSHNGNNFVAAQEITVTITLAEYRDLIEKAATRKTAIDAAEQDMKPSSARRNAPKFRPSRRGHHEPGRNGAQTDTGR